MKPVFEIFDFHARKASEMAQREAQKLNHQQLGCEHLLLGILSGEDPTAAILRSHGLSLSAVRQKIVAIYGAAAPRLATQVPFAPETTEVLQFALKMSSQMNAEVTGTGHILLGLLRETDRMAVRLLREYGVDLEHLRGQMQHLLLTGGRQVELAGSYQ